jgi:hypothetical protein
LAQADGYATTMTHLKHLLKLAVGLHLSNILKKIYSNKYTISKNSDNINMVVKYSPSL